MAAYRCSKCGSEMTATTPRFGTRSSGYRHALESDCVAAAPAPVATVEAPADTRRRNRFPGTCECGRHVPAGVGFIENDGGWRVFCGGCGLSSTVG